MEAHESNIRRQLYVAVQAYRNGKLEPYVQFIGLFEDSKQAVDLFDVINGMWTDCEVEGASKTELPSTLSRRALILQSAGNLLQPTVQELLRIAMCVPAISNSSAIAAIKHIQDGTISGRSAIFCMSDIRASIIDIYSMPLTARASSSFDDKLQQSFLDRNLVPFHPQSDVETAIQHARSLAEACMFPYFSIRSAASTRYSDSERNHHLTASTPSSGCAICLELLPLSIGALVTLRRRWNEKIEHDRAADRIAETRRESESVNHRRENRENERRLPKVDVVVLDMLMSNEWHPAALLAMASAVCEMYPYMKTRHLCELKRRLLGAAILLQQQQQRDDFAGVLRVCLRLFEQSGDPCWVHVLRVLFANVPASEEQTVESLLEQIFSQASRLSEQVVEVIEAASSTVCSAFSESGIGYNSPSSSDPKKLLGSGTLGRTYRNRMSESIQQFSTHREYQGTPLPTIADINLLLLLSRTGGSGLNGSSNEILLPTVLADCTEVPPAGQLRIARALSMTILCCATLEMWKSVDKEVPVAATRRGGGGDARSRSKGTGKGASKGAGQGRDRGSAVVGDTEEIRERELNFNIVNECARLVARSLGVSFSPSSPLSSSSSSSSSAAAAVGGAMASSWLHYTRAAELITAALYWATLSQLTFPCMQIALKAVYSIQLQASYSRDDHSLRHGSNASASSDVVSTRELLDSSADEGTISNTSIDFAVEILVTVFKNVESCREQLVYAILQGLSSCPSDDLSEAQQLRPGSKQIYPSSSRNSVSRSILDRNRDRLHLGSNVTGSRTAQQQQQQSTVNRLARLVFLRFFSRVCSRYSLEISDIHSCIDRMLPALTMSSIADLESVVKPLILHVTVYSPQLQGSVLNICRKALLHKDTRRKEFAIRSLVTLLSVVAEDHQMQVTQAILHVFSLPLPCRRLLYSELLRLLMRNGSSNHGSASSSASAAASAATATAAASTREDGFQPGNDVRLCRQVVEVLWKKASDRLLYFIDGVSGDEISNRFPFLGEMWKSKSRDKAHRNQATKIAVPVFNPEKCIDTLRIGKCTSSLLNEDLLLLMKLTWQLETHLHPGTILQLADELSSTVSLLPSGEASLNAVARAKAATTPAAAAAAAACSKSSWKCSGANGDVKRFQPLYERVFQTRNSQNEWIESDRDRGKMSEFMWAVMRFIALGLPKVTAYQSDGLLPREMGGISRGTGEIGSGNIDTSLPSKATATESVKPGNAEGVRALVGGDKVSKDQENSLLLAHLSCCHSIVNGFIHCLMAACSSLGPYHRPSPSAAPTARYGTGTAAEDGSHSELRRSLLSAVTVLEGLDDMLLEAAISASSSSSSEENKTTSKKHAKPSSGKDAATSATLTGAPSTSNSSKDTTVGTKNNSIAAVSELPVVVKNFASFEHLWGSKMNCSKTLPSAAAATTARNHSSSAISDVVGGRSAISLRGVADILSAAVVKVSTPPLTVGRDEEPRFNVPVTARLGALAHACYEASIASAAVITECGDVVDDSVMGANGSSMSRLLTDRLVDLTILRERLSDAYSDVLSIAREDALLDDAANAVKDLIYFAYSEEKQRQRQHAEHTAKQQKYFEKNCRSGSSSRKEGVRRQRGSKKQITCPTTSPSTKNMSRAIGGSLGAGEEKVSWPDDDSEDDCNSRGFGVRTRARPPSESRIELHRRQDSSSEEEVEYSSDDSLSAGGCSENNDGDGHSDLESLCDASNEGTVAGAAAAPASVCRTPMLLLAAFNSMPSDIRKHLDRLDMFDCTRTTVLTQAIVASAAVPPLSTGASKSMSMPLAAYDTSEQSESEGHNSDANPASDSEGPQQLLDMTPEEVMSMIRRQQERKDRKAEKARRLRQRAMRNQQQAQLESLQAESEQFELLSEGIAMRVQKQREALQQAQEDAERAHLESEQRRAAVSVKETIRYTLFSVRCEALGAISEVTKAIHYVEGLIATMRLPRIRAGERVTATQEVTVEAPSQEAEEIFAMAHRWACELLAAVEKGITIRAFKAYVDVLMAVTEGLPRQVLGLRGRSLSRMPSSGADAAVDAVAIVETLQNVLRFLDSPHALLLSSVVNLVMTFCGHFDALLRCEDIIRSIGNRCFFVKEKRQKKNVVDENPSQDDESAEPTETLNKPKGNPLNTSSASLQLQRFVTKKLSDATLGEVLRYIDQRLQLVVLPVASTEYGAAHSNVDASPHSSGDAAASASKDCNYLSSTGAAQDAGNEMGRICRCVFALFEYSIVPVAIPPNNSLIIPLSNRSHMPSNAVSNVRYQSTTKTTASPSLAPPQKPPPLLLAEISDRRRIQVMNLAIKFIARCNRDCGKLHRAAVADRKLIMNAAGATARRKRDKESMRGDGFSDSEIDTDSNSDDSVDDDAEVSTVGINSDRNITSARGDQNKEDVIAAVAEESDAMNFPPVPLPSSFLYLHGLLSSNSVQALVNAKEWIHKPSTRTSIAGKSSGRHQGDDDIEYDDSDDDDRSQSDDSSGDDDDGDGGRTNKRKRTRSSNSPRSTNSAGAKSTATMPNAMKSDKYAHSLVFKIEELEWRLRSLLQELDRTRDVRHSLNKASLLSASSSYLAVGYSSGIAGILGLVDRMGRDLLLKLHSTVEPPGKERTHRHAAGSSRAHSRGRGAGKGRGDAGRGWSSQESKKPSHRQKGRGDDGSEEELSDESGSEYEEEDGDEDKILGDDGEDSDNISESAAGAVKRRKVEVDGGAISERSQAFIQRASSVVAAVGPGSRKHSKSVASMSTSYGGSAASSARARSRNRVIDTWLDDEDGSDTYADLEDFLVE